MLGLRQGRECFSAHAVSHFAKKFSAGLRAFIFASLCWSSAEAARQAEYLDRGVVAMPSGSGVFVSWRMLGDDPTNISFNVYRNGTKITSNPITNSTNYFDGSGTTNAAYTIRPLVNGAELTANAAKATWTNPYLLVNLQKPSDGTTPSGESYSYSPNDLSVGDLDGDGQYEIIVKWDPSNAKDNSQSGYTGNVFIDAYKLNGNRLWRIDLGKNIRAGAHYTQFMVYDLDGDGKAEIAMKTAPGTRDAYGTVLGGSNAYTDYRNSGGYILSGPEYLTIFNGETGAAMATTDYVPARGTVSAWGDNYGNRVDRFLGGIAYLDGSRPSLIMSRGYYTRAVVAAWDWRNGQLSQRWIFDSNNGGGAVAGQGAHTLSVGDVDGDGKDEIVYGAATIDDNGRMLYSTNLCHGDALHLGDLDPTRSGLEIFMVHESPSCYGNYGLEMHDAKTGSILWGISGGGADVGRGVSMDIDPRYAGNENWASVGGLYTAKGQQISSTKPNSTNFSVLWDADLLAEQLNNTMINKWNYSSSTDNRLLTAYNWGAATNNGTKATPGISADILGDWREEVIWRVDNNYQLIIFSTTAVTSNKLRTLMHDSQYRQEIARQNVGYNQPPHTSFFLGEGMSIPAAPSIYFVGNNPNSTIPMSSSSSVASSGVSSVAPVSSSSRSSSSLASSSVASSLRSSSLASSSVASSSAISSSVASSSSSQSNSGATCTYVITNQWGTGYTAAIRIFNKGSSAINGWTVSWTYSSSTNVTSSWNAILTGTNPYSASGLNWNSTISPGQTVEFGFQGNQPANVNEIPKVTGSICN
ncbi:MAG: pseudouridine synthase [Gammaproteobacteria bacterium]|nr:MAG: pseudouridine synthase [Gammaproteobacteria bacterium]